MTTVSQINQTQPSQIRPHVREALNGLIQRAKGLRGTDRWRAYAAAKRELSDICGHAWEEYTAATVAYVKAVKL